MILKEQLAEEIERKIRDLINRGFIRVQGIGALDGMRVVKNDLATWICENVEAYVDEEKLKNICMEAVINEISPKQIVESIKHLPKIRLRGDK